MIYKHMDYIPFDIKNPYCLHVMLSDRAYRSIINETFEHGTDETGGLLMGYIIGRKWYVVEVIDPGTNNTIHETGLFQWDQDHVNKMANRMRNLYRYQPTILGFWHRHPGSMDFFSQQDVESTQKNLQGARKGLISMLVNIDPALRMTFYHCHGPHFMPIRYDVGDEYFPVELLEYATPEMISQRHMHNQRGQTVKIIYNRVLPPQAVGPMKHETPPAVPAPAPSGPAEPAPESAAAAPAAGIPEEAAPEVTPPAPAEPETPAAVPEQAAQEPPVCVSDEQTQITEVPEPAEETTEEPTEPAEEPTEAPAEESSVEETDSAPHAADDESQPDQEITEKKKNIFRRFFAWLKALLFRKKGTANE